MSSQRTAWHFFFTVLLRKRRPSDFEVREEVPLSEEPPRLDYLLLRRQVQASAHRPAETLRNLWPRLPRVTVVEFKSIGRPYRKGNLDRLWAYIHLYFSDPESGLKRPKELCGLLVVAARTLALDVDARIMGLQWGDLGGGYWELRGGLFRLYVVELDRVAEYEQDDVLRLFGHAKVYSLEARRFWAEQVGTKEAMMALHELEGYDEVVQKFLELIPPEQRLVGLAPEQAVLALPNEVLRALSNDFLEGLPEPTRSIIRRRLGR